MAKIEVGIVLRVAPGAPPVVIGAVADEELLRHALRVALDAAALRAGTSGELPLAPCPNLLM